MEDMSLWDTFKGFVGNFSTPLPKTVYVFVAVDISSSMKGAKIKEVCQNLGELIKNCPDEIYFALTLFSNHAIKKIAFSSKSSINISSLMDLIKKTCGQQKGTALFDTLFEIIESIPQRVLDQKEVQIAVLSDGNDDCSKVHDLRSVTNLMHAKLSNRTKFSMILVNGPLETKNSNESVVTSLQNLNVPKQIQAQCVENSAEGIRIAMQSVSDDILAAVARAAERRKSQKESAAPSPNVSSSLPLTVESSDKMTAPVIYSSSDSAPKVGHYVKHSSQSKKLAAHYLQRGSKEKIQKHE